MIVHIEVLITSQDSDWPGRRRQTRPGTLENRCTPGWLWRWRWPRPPGTVEQRWPAGAALPVGCGPGCWTDIPHRSYKGSGCRKRQETNLIPHNNEHILKPRATTEEFEEINIGSGGDGDELHLELFHHKQTTVIDDKQKPLIIISNICMLQK